MVFLYDHGSGEHLVRLDPGKGEGAYVSTVPAPPPIEAISDEWFEEEAEHGRPE